MRIPHIYHIIFSYKENNQKVILDYWGMHWSWESTWDNIKKNKFDEGKKYITGSNLEWKLFFILFIPNFGWDRRKEKPREIT